MNLKQIFEKIRNFVTRNYKRFLFFLIVLGPGLITGFADNDAGGVATYSVAAAKFGYGILTTLIPITIVLAVSQEIGARLAVITGKGLGDLIRERYGIKISILIFLVVFMVNFGVILQDVSGLKGALQLFNLDYRIFLPLVLLLLFIFLVKSSFSKIERFFLFLILFYLTYVFSAVLAKPDWGLALKSIVIPPAHISFSYLYTSIAVLGTTVTIWGQFFINSYIKDKKLTPSTLKYEQFEVYLASILSDASTWFIMLAVVATLYVNRIPIEGAAEAALAIKPFAGPVAGILFGAGLLIAGFIGCAIVPLATAYAFSEFFGYSGSLEHSFKKSRLFYTFFIIQIILGAIVVMQPKFSLFKITLYADFLNGISLPIIFFFLYKFSNDKELLGSYRNSRLQNFLLAGSGIVISIAALLGVFGELLHIG